MLLVDLGNSRIKWVQYGNGALSESACAVYGENLAVCLDAHWRDLSKQEVALVSVADPAVTGQLLDWCQQHWQQAPHQYQTTAMAAGVTNGYDNFAQLGVDRWAAMVAAYNHHGGPVCVVDVGTAVTLDVIDAHGIHQGGLIMPGVAALWRVLQVTTAQVLVKQDVTVDDLLMSPDTILGTSTQQCVAAGIRQAVTGAIEKTLRQLKKQDEGNMRYLLTGGSAPAMAKLVDKNWQQVPDLVLQGLALLVDER